MSVLSAEIHAALAQTLQALQSSDNNLRTQAEEQLQSDWTAGRPDVLLMGLVEQTEGAQEPAVIYAKCRGLQRLTCVQTRSFAAVLFRRIASKTHKPPGSNEPTELFLSLGQEQRAAIRQKLLACFPNEKIPHVRNKVGDAIAELARQYTDHSNLCALARLHSTS